MFCRVGTDFSLISTVAKNFLSNFSLVSKIVLPADLNFSKLEF